MGDLLNVPSITEQEKALLDVLRQIKLEGEVRIGLAKLLKVQGVSNYNTVAGVLTSQGFIQNQSVSNREGSVLVWNRSEPPNINNVRAIIKEAKRLSAKENQKHVKKVAGINQKNQLKLAPMPERKPTQEVPKTEAPKTERSVEYEALKALQEKAIKDFDVAKEKLNKINDLIKLYG